MSRAIPILNVYEQAIRGTGAKAIMLCANNYPGKFEGNVGFDRIFYFNRLLREKCGLKAVEVSDDCWEAGQLLFPDAILKDGRHFRRMDELAAEAGVYFAAMGTGAFLSYAYQKGLGVAFFDLSESGQKFMLKIYNAWADFGAASGIELMTGRRPGIIDDKTAFVEKIRLGDISDFVKEVSIIDMGQVKFDGLDSDAMITKSEAMNLALAWQLNQYSLKRPHSRILQSVEQMQYAGMEPNTVEQVVRVNQFLKVNLGLDYFVDMADNGHVGVRGSRTTNNPDDYDLFKYADAYHGPVLFIHHNILFENAKEPGTTKNLERDMAVQKGQMPAKDMPYPDRIRDINDYLLRALRENPRVEFVIASPEPKFSTFGNVDRLADDVAESLLITATRIRETGEFEESQVLPLTFVSKGHRERVDAELKKHVA